MLAIVARSGNAGSNTAADDYIVIIAAAIAAIAAVPARWRHNLSAQNARPAWSVQYSVGFDLDERIRTAITALPEHV